MEIARPLRSRRQSSMYLVLAERACLAIMFLAVSVVAGCSDGSAYASFSSNARELDFTFEYPRGEWPKGWLITPPEQYQDLVKVNMLGPDPADPDRESSLDLALNVWLGLGTMAEQKAQDMLADDIATHERTPSFRIVRRETIVLDRHGGYLVEYIYDFDTSFFRPPGMGFLLPTRVLNIAIPREDKVYQIWISASQNEWNAREADIQHILETFRWK